MLMRISGLSVAYGAVRALDDVTWRCTRER